MKLKNPFSGKFKWDRIQTKLSQIDWLGGIQKSGAFFLKSAERAKNLLEKKSTNFYGLLATVTLCSYFLSDLSALFLERFLPEPPRSFSSIPTLGNKKNRTIENYQSIVSRNLFNSKGLIPGDDTIGGDGPPVKTNLGIDLLGTVILQDPQYNLATIFDRTSNETYPVRAEEEIPSKIKVVSIEPRKVIFINLQSRRKEYVDIPEDATFTNPVITPRSTVGKPAGVEKVSSSRYQIPRSEIDQSLSNLNKVLTEARAVPNFENGMPSGYKLFQIVPGSIFAKIGLQNGDVIKGVGGETINDPAKAFEKLSDLKTSQQIEINIKRDGRDTTILYDIVQ